VAFRLGALVWSTPDRLGKRAEPTAGESRLDCQRARPVGRASSARHHADGLPVPAAAVEDRAVLKVPAVQADLIAWSEQLGRLGFVTTPEEFEEPSG